MRSSRRQKARAQDDDNYKLAIHHYIYRIDLHAASWRHMTMKILIPLFFYFEERIVRGEDLIFFSTTISQIHRFLIDEILMRKTPIRMMFYSLATYVGMPIVTAYSATLSCFYFFIIGFGQLFQY